MQSLLFLLLWGVRAWAGELALTAGEVRSLPAAPGASVTIGSRAILKVIDGGRSIRVVALKTGVTTLVIGPRVYRVRVGDERQGAFQRELRATLATFRGLTLQFDDGRPEIGGTLLRFSDWLALADLARRRRGEYGFRARVLKSVGEAAIAHFNRLARDRGYPSVRFRVTPEFTVVLPAGPRDGRRSAELGFATFGIRVDSSGAELDLKPLVRTHVVLAEVSRAFSRNLGLSWPSEYAAQVIPRPTADGQLLTALRALESRGQAQVLAAPDLTCRSGGEARFHAGGELPIRTASRTRQGVEWKSFGVLLNVRPKADHQGNLSLTVKTEISLVDFANAVDGVPALKTNVVESQFDLPGRRTIALSGLIRRDQGSSDDGLPFLSALPLLGRLFSSRQYQKNQSELIVFVTPEIYVPEPDFAPVMPAGWIHDE